MADMSVKILPALADNYMYLIICNKTKEAAIVDPVNPESVLEAVQNENVKLKSVLTTHHHWDHAGGNEKLVTLFKDKLIVYGGDERIGAMTNKIGQDDTFKIGNLDVQCHFTPCHTTGHICYFVQTPARDSKAVFTGDTLFLGGCGRFFEGTAEQMYSALIEKLSNLPDETKVFCGHEYSLQNLKFANHVEPQNVTIQNKIEWSKAKRANNEPTVPSTIGEEKEINPFMRVCVDSVQQYAKSHGNPIEAMRAIRKVKDSFK
ncbi:CLUMA_CG017190, isoform A [Clunio marinus]|uniref:hydroxyacylglutathione hydrolase n=1 Tax=Clunio marinus TaxID=568069 RepID=A0A1J1IV41_9DIPT|nr:CLUMA_CG017190, isoform A [Clunio marinus]